MKIETYSLLLTERLRPTQLDQVILPASTLSTVDAWLNAGLVPNLLLFGSPGTGKSSLARIIVKRLGALTIRVNGSSKPDVKDALKKLDAFCSSIAVTGEPKICVIEEADYLSKDVQAALRTVTEDYSALVRFIFTANEVERLIPAIQSRFVKIDFDDLGDEVEPLKSRLKESLGLRLQELGLSYQQSKLEAIVDRDFPDYRSIANALELEVN